MIGKGLAVSMSVYAGFFVGGAAGLAAGGLAGWTLRGVGDALDKGISYTYRCAELDAQANERDVLRDLGQTLVVGQDTDVLEAVLRQAGLDVIKKGDEGLIVGPVFLSATNDRVSGIDISGIDGRCPPPKGGN